MFTNNYTQNGFTPSASQIDMYNRLCTQKNVSVGDVSKMTRTQLTAEISKLQLMRPIRPMSVAQEDIIKDNCAKLSIKCPDLTNWTTEQASTFIARLFEKAREAKLQEPASERQMNMLAQMFDMELINELPTEMTRQEASDIIESMMPAYNAWLREHASQSQIITIQSLQRRIGDVVLGNDELRKMSRDTASTLIETLNNELKHQREVLNGKTIFHEKEDTSRSTDVENINKSWEAYTFETKRALYAKLVAVWGGDVGNEVNEKNIDKLVKDAIADVKFYTSEDSIRDMVASIVVDNKTPMSEETKKEVIKQNRRSKNANK